MSALTEEQSLIREQASAWAVNESPVSRFRALRDSRSGEGFVADTWAAMVDMGWSGILVPEQYGGSNLGFLTFGLILEELGRQLAASPLFTSSLVGASALLLGGRPDQHESILPKIVDGSALLTLALDESARHAPLQTALSAVRQGDGFTLTWQKTVVPEGMSATLFVVRARTSGQPGE